MKSALRMGGCFFELAWRGLVWVTLCGTFSIAPAVAQDFPHTSFHKVGNGYQMSVGQLPSYYFEFQHSADLHSYITVDMALGAPGPTFSYTPAPGAQRGFFRAKAVDEWSPGDADNDGIDDLYELKHGLNPMNGADAAFPSLESPGMTNLEMYRSVYGLTRVTEYYSAETSVFNSTFGISTEVSVFNFPNATGARVEAISAEVSLYNTAAFTGAAIQAASTEVSVYNTPAFTGPAQEAVSAEVSVFNFYTATPAARAISLEVSVLNTLP